MNRRAVNDELDCCPRCHGKAEVKTGHSPAGYEIKYVRCTACGIRTDGIPMEEPNKTLIDMWNWVNRRFDDVQTE